MKHFKLKLEMIETHEDGSTEVGTLATFKVSHGEHLDCYRVNDDLDAALLIRSINHFLEAENEPS